MTSRVLTLIACLLVALPQRVCVCAGEAYACTGKSCAVTPAPAKVPEQPQKRCACKHSRPAPAPAEAQQAPTEPESPAAPHEHKRHQSHCPAVADARDASCPAPVQTPVPPADTSVLALTPVETTGFKGIPCSTATGPLPAGPPRHVVLQVFLI